MMLMSVATYKGAGTIGHGGACAPPPSPFLKLLGHRGHKKPSAIARHNSKTYLLGLSRSCRKELKASI